MQLNRSIVAMWLLLAFLPGCIDLYGHRNVEMQVKDAETLAPISNAHVIWDCLCGTSLNPPGQYDFTTGIDGTVSGRVAIYDHAWSISAKDIPTPFLKLTRSSTNPRDPSSFIS